MCIEQQLPTDRTVTVSKLCLILSNRIVTAVYHHESHFKSPIHPEHCCLLSSLALCVAQNVLQSAALPDLQLLPANVFHLSFALLLLLLRKNVVAVMKRIFVLELLLNFHFGIYFIRHIACCLEAYASIPVFQQ